MEVRLDDLNGPVLCQIKIPNTGDFQKWTNVSAPTGVVRGEHSVYILFLGEPGPLFGIQYFELTPAAPIAPAINDPVEVDYALGCTVAGDRDADEFQRATNAANSADVALVFVGVDEQLSIEGIDRKSIELPGVQSELVSAVYAANPRTVARHFLYCTCGAEVGRAEQIARQSSGVSFSGSSRGARSPKQSLANTTRAEN